MRTVPFAFAAGLFGVGALHAAASRPQTAVAMVCVSVLTIVAMFLAHAGDLDQRRASDEDDDEGISP